MALILCEECGKQISDKATTCPGCGCPMVVTRHANEARNASVPKRNRPSVGTMIVMAILGDDVKIKKGKNVEWSEQEKKEVNKLYIINCAILSPFLIFAVLIPLLGFIAGAVMLMIAKNRRYQGVLIMIVSVLVFAFNYFSDFI